MSGRNLVTAASARNGGTTVTDRSRRVRERNDHDAATVLAVVLALSGGSDAEESTSAATPSVWSDPAFRLEGARHPSPVAWWASAMPR